MMRRFLPLVALLALASCTGEPVIAADLPERVVSLVKAEGADRVVIMVGSSGSTDLQAVYEAHPDAFCADARSIVRFFDNRELDGHAILFTAEPDTLIWCPAAAAKATDAQNKEPK